MNRTNRLEREVFERLFPLALEKIETIDELPERINRAIQLLFPLSVFETAPTPNAETVTAERFAERIFERIESLESGGERDYLLRLLASEAITRQILPQDRIKRLIEAIEGDDEKQTAYYVWGKFLASDPAQRRSAFACAERLDDLASYEKVVRRILFTNGTLSDDESNRWADSIESAEGRFRLAVDRTALAAQSAQDGEPGRLDSALQATGERLEAIDDTRLRDEMLAVLFERLAALDYGRLAPFVGRFSTQTARLDALERYVRVRSVETGRPLADVERESLARDVKTAVEGTLGDPSFDASDRIDALTAAARIDYRIGEKSSARDEVRALLGYVKTLSNRVERTNVYQALWPLLADAGERKALDRILDALETAADEIEPDDLRTLVWRENLLRALNRGEFPLVERFLPKIPLPGRAVFLAATALRSPDATADSVLAAAAPLEKADPLEAAAGRVKIARYAAVRVLESE